MPSDEQKYTFNPLNNDDKELLLAHGYKPGELPPEVEQEILTDLREQTNGDYDSEHPSNVVTDLERDGTE